MTYTDELYALLAVSAALVFLAWLVNFISYRLIKERTLRERRWDYNISCGTTDGGGINADIVRHADVPNFELVADPTRLPHPDLAFEHLLSSHTIEHVDDPRAFYAELRRVSRNVTLLVPPLWDFTAALNIFEHRVIFLTMKSRHDNHLPPFVEFHIARAIQSNLGQRIEADMRAKHAPLPAPFMLDFAIPASLLSAMVLFLENHWAGFLVGVVAAALLLFGKKHTSVSGPA